MSHMERLKKIGEQAAEQASGDLTKLTGKEIDLAVSTIDVRTLNKIEPTIKREDMVVGVYMPVTGEVPGSALLVFPPESAFVLSDIMVGRAPGTTKKLTKLDESAMEEAGSIIACSYIGVLGNMLQAKIVENPPKFQMAMFGSLLEQSITNFSQKAEKAFLVEIKLVFKEVSITGFLLLLFGAEEIEAILTSLDK